MLMYQLFVLVVLYNYKYAFFTFCNRIKYLFYERRIILCISLNTYILSKKKIHLTSKFNFVF